MICPRCGAVNKDNAVQCRQCSCRLVGVRVTPEARRTEQKYLIAGIASFIGIILVIVLLFTSINCIACKDGCTNGGTDYINENVDGDWNAEVSPTDVSYTDATQMIE